MESTNTPIAKPPFSSKELRRQYELMRPDVARFCHELSQQLQHLLATESISLGFPIEARVKTLESTLEKFERLNLRFISLTQLQDLIGFRLTLLFRRDVGQACEVLERHLKIIRRDDTAERLKTDQFGYSSIHLIVQLKAEWLSLPTMRGLESYQAEIQVRSLAQHTWAAAGGVPFSVEGRDGGRFIS